MHEERRSLALVVVATVNTRGYGEVAVASGAVATTTSTTCGAQRGCSVRDDLCRQLPVSRGGWYVAVATVAANLFCAEEGLGIDHFTSIQRFT